MAIPGTPEYHRQWTAEKAARDADAASRAALAEHEWSNPPSEDPYGPQLPPNPSDITWTPPEDLGRAVSDYEAEMMAQENADIERGVSPMAFAEGAGIASGASRQSAADLRATADQTYQAPSAPNPVRPIREQHAATALDLMGAAHDAKGLTAQAQTYEMDATAQAYEQEAARQSAMIDAQHAKLIRDSQRRDMAIEAERHVFEQIQNASDKLAKTPDDDRGRYWASRKWWQKFAWAISAIADGMRGLDPMAALNSAIEGDIREQQAAREARRGELAAATSQLADVRSIYADLRSSIGDEDATHDAMRIARYEQAKAMLMAEQLRNGIPLQMAMANEGIIELDQKINDTSAALRERLALTPERIGGGTKYVLPADQRARLHKQADAEDAHARALQMKGIDVGAGAATQERAGQIEIEKERAKAGQLTEGDKRIAAGERQFVVKETLPYRKEVRLIKQFREGYKNGIPGLVWGLGWQKKLRSDEAIQAYERLKRIVVIKLRRESGANTPDSEIEREAGALLDAMDEDDVNNMLDDRLAEAEDAIDQIERGVSEQTNEDVNRARAAPRAPRAAGGVGLPDVLDYEDE